MNLFRESGQFGQWAFQVLGAFVRARPATTLTAIVAAGIARIASLLAFFLPLKIIILAASDGVPRYFQGFIAPHEKMEWIIGLAVATVVLYVVNLSLDGISKRLAATGSRTVTRRANKIRILENEDEAASTYYQRFCKLAADTLFILLGLGVGVWLVNTPVFTLVFVLIACAVVFTAWVFSGEDPLNPGPIRQFAENRLSRYIRVWTAMIFLSSFLLILYPYLVGQQPNLLLSILSILILRQLTAPAEQTISEAVRLFRSRPKINALVFEEARYSRHASRRERPLEQIFGRSARHEVGIKRAGELGLLPDTVRTLWQDLPFPGTQTLHIAGTSADDARREAHFQLQAYRSDQVFRLDNEAFLLSHVPADALKAPRTLTRFSLGPYDCRVIPYGNGEPVSSEDWKHLEPELFLCLWGLQPPASLVAAYSGSRPLLHQELLNCEIDRLDMAVDTEEESACLQWLRGNLEAIAGRLAGCPNYIHNLDLSRRIAVASGDDIQLLTWGHWTLLPVGAVRPPSIKDDMLPGMLARIAAHRDDLPPGFGAEDLRFAAHCSTLQQSVRRNRLKASLESIAQLRRSWAALAPLDQAAEQAAPAAGVAGRSS